MASETAQLVITSNETPPTIISASIEFCKMSGSSFAARDLDAREVAGAERAGGEDGGEEVGGERGEAERGVGRRW